MPKNNPNCMCVSTTTAIRCHFFTMHKKPKQMPSMRVQYNTPSFMRACPSIRNMASKHLRATIAHQCHIPYLKASTNATTSPNSSGAINTLPRALQCAVGLARSLRRSSMPRQPPKSGSIATHPGTITEGTNRSITVNVCVLALLLCPYRIHFLIQLVV